ncbi:ATP-binding cassette domain-containing protein [Rhizobium sp. AN73]|uniref:ATP-binding cassette domain-containing protein n=1 Tax=Rhizobium sp. AN73 TaxID=3035124 RepID=UPI00274197A6|nr:ATP-binding cassette domain-containing protein [Rhizobium sp. AN73]
MGAELLRVAKLAKSFGAYQVLQDVRFDVNEGEIVGLLGPNGSGKSTALNIISGFMSGDGGQVLFQGNDITQARVQEITRSGLIRTFQLPSMPHRMTVREVVRAGQSQASNMLAPIRSEPRSIPLSRPSS